MFPIIFAAIIVGCKPNQKPTLPPVGGKIGADVDLFIEVSPEDPKVGDEVTFEISAYAYVDIPEAEITLSLRGNHDFKDYTGLA